ncbi:MAG: SIS domain-containing protein [Lentisphaeria bacterium]|nr:SIS domain-containing protein [Lentisphaeria bacterium]
MEQILIELETRYPALAPTVPKLREVIETSCRVIRAGGTIFTAGNGGSGSDAEHIAGELIKGFLSRRPLPESEIAQLAELYGDEGLETGRKLQQGIRCISLLSHPGYLSAFANDVDPELVYAQQLHTLGRSGDIVLGITCSGNAGNIRRTFMVARQMGITTVLLTGAKAGKCVPYADLVIDVPATEVFKIQELHLPVYHAFCAAVEAVIFEK